MMYVVFTKEYWFGGWPDCGWVVLSSSTADFEEMGLSFGRSDIVDIYACNIIWWRQSVVILEFTSGACDGGSVYIVNWLHSCTNVCTV